MRHYIRIIAALVLILSLIFFGCKDNLINDPEIIEDGVNILSPEDNSKYAKFEDILFEAELVGSNNKQAYDSIKWESNISGIIVRTDKWERKLDSGTHLISCKIFRR